MDSSICRRTRLLTAAALAVLTFFVALAPLSAAASPAVVNPPQPSAVDDASTSDGSAAAGSFIREFSNLSTGLWNRFSAAARRIFWILALIQLTWAGIRLLFRGDFSIMSFFGTIIYEVLFIGLFWWLLTIAPRLLSLEGDWSIIRSLRQLAGADTINPAGIFAQGVEIVWNVTDIAFKMGVHSSLWAVVPYAITLGAFALTAAFAAVYLIEYFIAVPLGLVILGLGGLAWTRKFVENYLRILISIGLKLACLQIVLGVSAQLLAQLIDSGGGIGSGDLLTVGSEGFFLHMFNLAGLAVLTFVVVWHVPKFAASLVSGAWFRNAAGYAGGPFAPAFGGAPAGPVNFNDVDAISSAVQPDTSAISLSSFPEHSSSSVSAQDYLNFEPAVGQDAWAEGLRSWELSETGSSISTGAASYKEMADELESLGYAAEPHTGAAATDGPRSQAGAEQAASGRQGADTSLTGSRGTSGADGNTDELNKTGGSAPGVLPEQTGEKGQTGEKANSELDEIHEGIGEQKAVMNGTKGQSKTGEAEQAADDLERGGSGPAGQNGPGEGQDASDKPRKADGVQSSSESDPAKSEHMRSVIRDALQDDEQRETEAAREVVRINVKGVSNVQRAVATGMTESDAEIEIS